MGWLLLKTPVTVIRSGGESKTYMAGINPDVTEDEASHWYVKASGGLYFDSLAEAMRNTPEALDEAGAARLAWQRTMTQLMDAQIAAIELRGPLVALEEQLGLNTDALDEQFHANVANRANRLGELRLATAGEDTQPEADKQPELPLTPAAPAAPAAPAPTEPAKKGK